MLKWQLLSNLLYRILESLDSLANNIPLSEDGEATIIQPNIAIRAQEVVPDNFAGLTFGVATNSDGNLDGNSLTEVRESTATIDIPDSLLAGVPTAERVAFGVLTNDAFFVQSSSTENRRDPVSLIISVDVFSDTGKETVSNLEPGISFTFTISNPSNGMCTFWDTGEF